MRFSINQNDKSPLHVKQQHLRRLLYKYRRIPEGTSNKQQKTLLYGLHLRELQFISYRDSRDPKVGPKHVVKMGECAPGDVVSLSTGCCNQQSLVLKPHNRLFLISASFNPET